MNAILHVSVKKVTELALKKMAEDDRRTFNAFIRNILEDYVDSKEKIDMEGVI